MNTKKGTLVFIKEFTNAKDSIGRLQKFVDDFFEQHKKQLL